MVWPLGVHRKCKYGYRNEMKRTITAAERRRTKRTSEERLHLSRGRSRNWGCQLPIDTWCKLTRTISSSFSPLLEPSPTRHLGSAPSSSSQCCRSWIYLKLKSVMLKQVGHTLINRWTHFATFLHNFVMFMGRGGLLKSFVGICRLHCLYPGHCKVYQLRTNSWEIYVYLKSNWHAGSSTLEDFLVMVDETLRARM